MGHFVPILGESSQDWVFRPEIGMKWTIYCPKHPIYCPKNLIFCPVSIDFLRRTSRYFRFLSFFFFFSCFFFWSFPHTQRTIANNVHSGPQQSSRLFFYNFCESAQFINNYGGKEKKERGSFPGLLVLIINHTNRVAPTSRCFWICDFDNDVPYF